MEERFIGIGKESARRYVEGLGIELTEELEAKCIDASWNWFVADMCDDYSRTLGEQGAIRKSMVEYLVGLGADPTKVAEMTRYRA